MSFEGFDVFVRSALHASLLSCLIDGGGLGGSVHGLGHKGGYLVVTKGAQEQVFIVHDLSSLSKGAELGELSGESDEGGMVFNGMGRAAFVEAVLQVRVQIREELLGKGAWPGGNCCGGRRIQRRNKGTEVLEDLHGGMV